MRQATIWRSLQITTITGIYGLSFLVAGYRVAARLRDSFGRASRVEGRDDYRRPWLDYCRASAAAYLVPAAQSHHVAHLVQTNFPQSEEYPPDWMRIAR